MNLIKYIVRRILISIPILLGVIVIVFFLGRAVPGDPVFARMPKMWTEEMYNKEKIRMGLDKPLFVQFIIYMSDLLRGDWGFSIGVVPYSKVADIIWQRLPRTLEIMCISMVLAVLIGVKLGKIAATHQNSLRDASVRVFSYGAMSVPGFIIGIFIVQSFLTTKILIFPLQGYKSVGLGNPPTITGFRIIDCILTGQFLLLADYLWHLTLPILAMTIVQTVIIIRQVRASLIDVLRSDYIRTARAKGCDENTIVKKHALKNALAPTLTVFTLGFPTIFAGNVAVEVVFDLKGMGQTFYLCLFFNDYNFLMIISYLTALIVIIFNLIADVLYAIIDPRIRLT